MTAVWILLQFSIRKRGTHWFNFQDHPFTLCCEWCSNMFLSVKMLSFVILVHRKNRSKEMHSHIITLCGSNGGVHIYNNPTQLFFLWIHAETVLWFYSWVGNLMPLIRSLSHYQFAKKRGEIREEHWETKKKKVEELKEKGLGIGTNCNFSSLSWFVYCPNRSICPPPQWATLRGGRAGKLRRLLWVGTYQSRWGAEMLGVVVSKRALN